MAVIPSPSPASETGAHRELSLAGETLWLLPQRAAWHPAARTLLIADAHLEKGSFLASHGAPLPGYDTRDTLARLARLIADYDPGTVVLLGDSFHDPRWEERLAPADRESLRALMAGRRWVWAEGNHDFGTAAALGGQCCEVWPLGALACFHAVLEREAGPSISGHWHPKVSLPVRGEAGRAPCFVVSGQALVLPAFGAFTGGLSVSDPAFVRVFGGRADLYPVVHGQVYALPGYRLSS